MMYAGFLGLFLLLPILILCLLLRRRLLDKRYWRTSALLLLPVLVCMAPWDHAAASWGIWNWTPQRIWGIRIWSVPLEDYLFSLLETMLTTMLVFAFSVWWDEFRGRSKL